MTEAELDVARLRAQQIQARMALCSGPDAVPPEDGEETYLDCLVAYVGEMAGIVDQLCGEVKAHKGKIK